MDRSSKLVRKCKGLKSKLTDREMGTVTNPNIISMASRLRYKVQGSRLWL